MNAGHTHEHSMATGAVATLLRMEDAKGRQMAVNMRQIGELVRNNLAQRCNHDPAVWHLGQGLTCEDAMAILKAKPGLQDCGFCGSYDDINWAITTDKAKLGQMVTQPGIALDDLYLCEDCHLLWACDDDEELKARFLDRSVAINKEINSPAYKAYGEEEARRALAEAVSDVMQQVRQIVTGRPRKISGGTRKQKGIILP